MIRIRHFFASVAVLSSLGFSPNPPGGDSETESPRERYEEFLAELRAARTLDLDAGIVVSRYRGGATSRSTGSLSASLGKGDRGRLRRTRDAKSTPNEDADSESHSIEILADGSVAYHVDREARAYVKVWPPRFLAGGENRSILPLRAFLGEAIERPIAVEFRQHPKHAGWSGFRLDFPGWNEVAYFDLEGSLRTWVRTDDVDGMRSSFEFRSFHADPGGDAANYGRRPPDDFVDATAGFARGARAGFRPARDAAISLAAGVGPTAKLALVPGASEVEAGFLDAEGSLVRLSAIRGRPLVLVFLDPAAPQCVDAVKRLFRLAEECEASGSRAQFLAVTAAPPRRRDSDPHNLRFVRPLAREIERAFAIYYHPTAFVLDPGGTVVLRASLDLPAEAIRERIVEH